jgi:hypothetical protein
MAHQALHYRYNPLHQDIICSETAIATLPATVDALGASRAMITCGPTILRACNVVPRVQEALGHRYVGVYAGVAPVWYKKSAVYTQLKLCLLCSQFTDPQSPLLGCVSYYRDSFARSRMSLRVSELRWKPNACN